MTPSRWSLYLARLGVGHLFCSPVLQAAPGSTHGYDVVDHTRIGEEIGGEEALRRLADISPTPTVWGSHRRNHVVPNHMAIPTPIWHNRALWSVLRDGPRSPFADCFDLDPSAELSISGAGARPTHRSGPLRRGDFRGP